MTAPKSLSSSGINTRWAFIPPIRRPNPERIEFESRSMRLESSAGFPFLIAVATKPSHHLTASDDTKLQPEAWILSYNKPPLISRSLPASEPGVVQDLIHNSAGLGHT